MAFGFLDGETRTDGENTPSDADACNEDGQPDNETDDETRRVRRVVPRTRSAEKEGRGAGSGAATWKALCTVCANRERTWCRSAHGGGSTAR